MLGEKYFAGQYLSEREAADAPSASPKREIWELAALPEAIGFIPWSKFRAAPPSKLIGSGL
jgi:hypothetical protein